MKNNAGEFLIFSIILPLLMFFLAVAFSAAQSAYSILMIEGFSSNFFFALALFLVFVLFFPLLYLDSKPSYNRARRSRRF